MEDTTNNTKGIISKVKEIPQKHIIIIAAVLVLIIILVAVFKGGGVDTEQVKNDLMGDWGRQSAVGVSYYTFSNSSVTFTRGAYGNVAQLKAGYYEIEKDKIIVTFVGEIDPQTMQTDTYNESETNTLIYEYKDGQLVLYNYNKETEYLKIR